MIKKIFLLLILLFNISCTAQKDKGYYFVDKDKVDNFDIYNFTKQDVIDNIGLPSLELDKNTWLYYSYTTKNLNFLKPKISKETILIVYFDNKDKIINFNLTKRDNFNNLKNNINKEALDNKNTNEEKKNLFFKLFEGLNFTPIQ